METLRKNQIEIAFLDAFLKVCMDEKIPPCNATIVVKFSESRDVKTLICQKDKVIKELLTDSFYSPKMVAIGMNKESLLKLLLCIHFAFTKGQGVRNEQISLIIYYSMVAGAICIGVLNDGKPQKTLIVSDIFEAMNLGTEQNN